MTTPRSPARIPAPFLQTIKCLACLVPGIILWFSPVPQGLNDAAWHLFALFVPTIIGLILKPLPMGAVAFVTFSLAIFLGLIPDREAFTAFSNTVVWLAIVAVFISQGFIITPLGERIAYTFLRFFGRKTLGISYGLALTDLCVAPAIPSTSARSAGIILPIVQSISQAYDSYPESPSARKIGAFLSVTAFQVTVVTSGMFMTAMAVNPLLASLLNDAGYTITWTDWAVAASVPGIASLMLIPLLIYKIYPPEIKDTPDATASAKAALKKMGPCSLQEKMFALTVISLITGWIFSHTLGVTPLTVALAGAAFLLLTGTLKWDVFIANKSSWNLFMWFSILLVLTKYLNQLGFFGWAIDLLKSFISGFNWFVTLAILGFFYFYSHYFFASSTAHVSVMFLPFVLLSIDASVAPMLAGLLFIFFSSLYGGLTHYSLTPAPIFYEKGYLDIRPWWRIGLLVSFMNIFIFSTLGVLWWKILGFF